MCRTLRKSTRRKESDGCGLAKQPEKRAFQCECHIFLNVYVKKLVFVLDLARPGLRPEFTRIRYDGKKPPPDPVERLWLRTIMVKQAALREMVLDVVISAMEMRSDEYPNGNFSRVSGGILTNYGIYDSTSHLKTDAVPLGGNIGFVDGHVAWRPFDDMGGRYGGDRLFWW